MEQDKRKNPELRPTEDFTAVYANNVNFEATAFDLKILFGELNQSFETLTVDQHTSVTMTWLEAKLLLHYLSVQLAAYEIGNGKIVVPQAILPPEPPPPTLEQQNEDPKALQVYETLIKMRREFVEK